MFVSCQQSNNKDNNLYFSKSYSYIFKFNQENQLLYKIPSFELKDFGFMTCEMKDGLYSCFDQFEQKEFSVSFNSKRGVSQLELLNVSNSLIHEFNTTYYQSVNHDNHKSEPMFFSVGLNGELIFSREYTFDRPTTTSMTFIPKYDRELGIIFYENDAKTKLFLNNESSENKLKITLLKVHASSEFFRQYDFEPIIG
ncbi:hypothetical protein BST97_08935 [Nonlabens spongiae]|uniref:Uncharacterized protein n=2 Tax=Nonlabens spongiae TaxID=331648 RepID=A0A1W6MKK6_9FLAO|nr:hypothetical protein BST97_08935 [Nonlabens spongiae]